MATWDGNNYYFSGQGVVLIGERDNAGQPVNLLPVGNVSALAIAIETAVLEHKESQTGSRGIDLRLTTETKANLAMTIENFNSANLEIALRGSKSSIIGGSTTDEPLYGAVPGAVVALPHIKVSAVTIEDLTGTPIVLTAYTAPGAAYDYQLNEDSGSIRLNDGLGAEALVNLGSTLTGAEAFTAYTIGTGAVFTVVSDAEFTIGDSVSIFGMAAGGLGLGGRVGVITAKGGTTLTTTINTTGFTTDAGTIMRASGVLVANYTYAAQSHLEALTEGSTDRYMRFEGLNTADGNNPVVVEVFKFSTDPLQSLALIGDEIQSFELAGNVLADPLQTSGSKFWRQRLLR